MGNALRYIGSHGRRLLNRYNAQFRALKFLDKEKLPVAPRHSTSHSVDEDPAVYEYIQKKDPELDKFLKDVYVTSHGEEQLPSKKINVERPLPVYGTNPIKTIFDAPVEIKKGFCTLSQFFELIDLHKKDPVKNDAAAIAKKYYLDVDKVEAILKYYQIFVVRVPKAELSKGEVDYNISELTQKWSKSIKSNVSENFQTMFPFRKKKKPENNEPKVKNR